MSQRPLIQLIVFSMMCASSRIGVAQNCKASGTTAWNAVLRNVVAGCAFELTSPNQQLLLKIAPDGRMSVDSESHHWRGPQLVPPAIISWSPKSDAFFVNDGEGSGLSSSFRLFKVKGTEVSEDKTIEEKAVSLFRRRTHCASSSADPNVWGFGWSTEAKAIYLLIQPTVNDSCGRPDHFISAVIRTSDAAVSEVLSKEQTKVRFGSQLPPPLFGN